MVSGDLSTTAYAQWVVIVIHNSTPSRIAVKNVGLKWGKFHEDDDKDDEINKSKIEGKVIEPGHQFRINSCGRSDASSGTEGRCDLYEAGTANKIRHIYWDCPWGSKQNTWRVTDINKKWVVESSGANLDSGALGTVTVDVFKKP